MSRQFRDWWDRCTEDPDALTPEEKKQFMDFLKDMSADDYREGTLLHADNQFKPLKIKKAWQEVNKTDTL